MPLNFPFETSVRLLGIATLICIERARGWREHKYIFSIDRGFDERVYEVLHESVVARDAEITFRTHGYKGPAHNILMAWRQGLLAREHEDDWVALIEDDILVGADFFEFASDALALDRSACGVSACRNQNRNGHPQGDTPSDVYQHVSYQSLGVALRPNLIERVIEMLEPAYFENPITFCSEKFPDSVAIPRAHASQDGLIHRIIRRDLLHMLYPITSRAFHVGWYGHNRAGTPLNDLVHDGWRAKARFIVDRMTTDQMGQLADSRFRDIDRCELTRARVALKLV